MSDKKDGEADMAKKDGAAGPEAAFDIDGLTKAADAAAGGVEEPAGDATDAAYDAAMKATMAAAARAGVDAAALPEFEPTADPLEDTVVALTAERDELKEKLMRALAEAENTRRRAERDRRDAEAYGGTKLARDLLSVHDNMERALSAADDAAKAAASSLIEGVELTQRELLSAFAKHKIETVAPEAGARFDPNLHQAMFEAPVPGAEPGTVIEVMQVGFTISGRLLRPALVGVAKAG